MHDRARAHGTRFFGGEEGAIREPPIANRGFGLSNGQHLGVGRGVFEQLHLIPGPRDHAPRANDDRTHRNFVVFPGAASEPQSLTHEVGVTVEVDGRFHEWILRDAS